MARGWESKSVEDQQDAAARERATRQAPAPTPEQQARAQQREGLRLARARTLSQLQNACRAERRAQLESMLEALDSQLRALDSGFDV